MVAKSLGSSNAINVVKATMEGLRALKLPEVERERRRQAQLAPTEEVREPRPERRAAKEPREEEKVPKAERSGGAPAEPATER